MSLRRAAWVAGLAVAQVGLLWGTSGLDGFGVSLWWHGASLVAVLAVSALLWRPMTTSRAFLALGVLASSVLALVSGFWLLYWKEGIRVDGYQDWGVFWHVAWSWAMMVFFVMHTWINRRAWLHFMRAISRARSGTLVHAGVYVALVVAIIVTWSTTGRGWFTNENYVPLSLYAWLLVVAPPFGFWVYVRSMGRGPGRAQVARRFGHWRVRALADVALVPTSALVVLSGVVLTFFDAYTDPAGLQYVSKNWHVLPSVLFSMLVFVHSVQAWPTVAAHWRRYGRSAAARRGRPGSSRPLAATTAEH